MTAVINAFRKPVTDPFTDAVRAEVVHVTPDIAERYLGKNPNNRPLKASKIAQYSRDMASGRWQMTGEAIKFDWEGNLRDGQNRLHAVIASGATVAMLVVRGLNPGAQEVMDSGAPRSAADALGLRGHVGGKNIAAVLNVYTCWERGLYNHAMASPDSKAKLTNSEVVDLAADRPDLIEATRFAARLRSALPVPVGALAVAYTVFSNLDADDAEEFFSRIANLTTSGKGDPIHTLIRRVGEYRERREQIRPATALYFLFRTWNAVRKGEELLKLQLGSELRGWVRIPTPI